MRITLRFIIPLILALSVTAYAAFPFLQKMIVRWHSKDLEIRSQLILKTLAPSLREILSGTEAEWPKKQVLLRARIQPIIEDERLSALIICNGGLPPVVASTAIAITLLVLFPVRSPNHSLHPLIHICQYYLLLVLRLLFRLLLTF